ncbi:MAG: hypothetical protein ACR2L9_00090 [Solirubrobacteraceae bacterium]
MALVSTGNFGIEPGVLDPVCVTAGVGTPVAGVRTTTGVSPIALASWSSAYSVSHSCAATARPVDVVKAGEKPQARVAVS